MNRVRRWWNAVDGELQGMVLGVLGGFAFLSTIAFFMPIFFYYAKEWWKFWL